jgi:death-on-curing protein
MISFICSEARRGFAIVVSSNRLAMPASTFDGVYLHSDLFEMAAAYAFHIAEGQPFVDGNKRTALNAALVFLDLTGGS